MIETRSIAETERAKYSAIWEFPDYRVHSPGLRNVDRFMAVVKPEPGSTLIDLGCGTGGAGLELRQRGLDVYWLDLIDDALDPELDRSRFIRAPLWDYRWPLRRRIGWEYGYCCDVLEHLPTELTMLAVANIVAACGKSWLQINFHPDTFGVLIGDELHLTVQPFTWWRDRLAMVGHLEEARDLRECGLFVLAGRL